MLESPGREMQLSLRVGFVASFAPRVIVVGPGKSYSEGYRRYDERDRRWSWKHRPTVRERGVIEMVRKLAPDVTANYSWQR